MAQMKNSNDFQTKQTNNQVENVKYPKRMQDVFDYLDENPMSIIGRKMEYKATMSLANQRGNLGDIFDKLETLDFDCSNKLKSIHHAQVCRGLLYLAMNGIDECHNLVTPLSWPAYSSFGGDPILHSSASQNACYAHALTHRREGQFVGEYGSGWNNSNYWSGQTGKHKVVYPQIAEYSYNNAKHYPKHKDIAKFLQSMLKMQSNEKQFSTKWNPRTFTDLCERAVKAQDVTLMQYCQDVANKEWKLLIQHCYQFV